MPIIVDTDKGKKIIHIECCPKDELVKLLKNKLDSEKMFFNDAVRIAENLNLESIKRFEEKYGTYQETRDGIQIDRFVEILAIVDQLKRSMKKN